MPDPFRNFDPGALRAPAPHTWAIGRSTVDGGLILSPAEAGYLREMFTRLQVAQGESLFHPAMMDDQGRMESIREAARHAVLHVAGDAVEVSLQPETREQTLGHFRVMASRVTVLAGGLKPPPADEGIDPSWAG